MWLKLGFLFITLVASSDDNKKIDEQISELKANQEKFKHSASKNANNAMRWQFQSENKMDARRAWDRAAHDQKTVEEIQVKIDELEALKKSNGSP